MYEQQGIKKIEQKRNIRNTYKVNNNVFTVTNTDTLANTGQIFYPIIILFVVGIILILLGIRIIRVDA